MSDEKSMKNPLASWPRQRRSASPHPDIPFTAPAALKPIHALLPSCERARRSFLLVVGLALALQGCSYALSPEITAKADRSVSFEELNANTARYAGRTVILGGVIAETKNLKKGTLIEVVQKELDYWGRPRRTDRSGGRFLVIHPAFLDAMIYAPGREITVGGDLAEEDRRIAGAVLPPYLLVRSRELKLWPGQARTSWDKPEWVDPLYDRSTQPGRTGY